ncbi:MAG: MFS transporter [Candidatus Bathyarchaeia archaeon]
MDQLNKIFSIQIINSLINGILMIALPLLMLSRGIDVVSLGLIYASLPIIFQLTRLFFATLSDAKGRKLFFVSNGILSVLTLFTYYLAFSPFHFLFGKITEGTRDASLWAVNRPSILDRVKEKRKVLSRLISFNRISEAVGRLASGFLIVWLLYENLILFCISVALLILPISLSLKETHREKVKMRRLLHFLDLTKKDKPFKRFLISFFFLGLSQGLIRGYVFPLFLKESGFEPTTIGILLAFQILFSGIVLNLFAGKSLKKILIYGGFFYSFTLFSIAFSGYMLAAIFIVLFGFAIGVGDLLSEGIFSIITKKGSYGSDIGLLETGFHAANTLSQCLSGIVIAILGFSPLFCFSSIIFILFSSVTYHNLKGWAPQN